MFLPSCGNLKICFVNRDCTGSYSGIFFRHLEWDRKHEKQCGLLSYIASQGLERNDAQDSDFTNLSMYTGFVQSLEFLKKSWNLPSNFSDLEKVWEVELKSWKNGKKSLRFFKVTCTLSALQMRCFCVCVLVKSYSFSLVCLQCIMEKALFFHSFSNLEYGKGSYCIGKVWKKFCSLDPKICTNPVLKQPVAYFSDWWYCKILSNIL